MQIPAKPLRVLYDEGAQMRELIGNLKHTYEVEKSAGFKYGDEFQTHLFQVGLDLCAFKDPAFREEDREIRLAHVCGIDRKAKKVLPAGARSPDGEKISDPLETRFRMKKGVLVPYVIVDYSNRGTVAPIKEIVLGPRNENAELNIEIFLNTIGVAGVTVVRSNAPYRK